jgi:hypothetical protein
MRTPADAVTSAVAHVSKRGYPNTKSPDQLKGAVAVWPRRKLPSSCQELRRQLFQFLQPSQHRVAAASSLSTGGKYGLIQDHS